MPYLPLTHLVPSDEVLTPYERDGSFGDFLGILNGGLDNENVPTGTVTDAKLGTDELFMAWVYEAPTTRTRVIDDAMTPARLDPVPDDSDAPWVLELTTPEAGDLHIVLSGSVGVMDGAPRDIDAITWFAIAVDGQVVAQTDIVCHILTTATYLIDARTFVDAGDHVIQILFGYAHDPSHTDLGVVSVVAAPPVVTFYERAVLAEWGCR